MSQQQLNALATYIEALTPVCTNTAALRGYKRGHYYDVSKLDDSISYLTMLDYNQLAFDLGSFCNSLNLHTLFADLLKLRTLLTGVPSPKESADMSEKINAYLISANALFIQLSKQCLQENEDNKINPVFVANPPDYLSYTRPTDTVNSYNYYAKTEINNIIRVTKAELRMINTVIFLRSVYRRLEAITLYDEFDAYIKPLIESFVFDDKSEFGGTNKILQSVIVFCSGVESLENDFNLGIEGTSKNIETFRVFINHTINLALHD